MNTQQRALTARALIKTFGNVHALAGVDITIPPGQSLAIMGPSGSGKSTLLHCLSGILSPNGGEVAIGDVSVSSLSDADRSRLRLSVFGFVFQDGQLIPELPARENVALPLMLRGMSRRDSLATADEWLGRMGLSDAGRRRPGEISGGQAQRVAVARALAVSPSVVFADEPTGALDQATGQEVMQLLTSTCRMSGATLVVVTHDPHVASWCDRLVEIRDGRIHADSARQPHAGDQAPRGAAPTQPVRNEAPQGPGAGYAGQQRPASGRPVPAQPSPGAGQQRPAGNTHAFAGATLPPRAVAAQHAFNAARGTAR